MISNIHWNRTEGYRKQVGKVERVLLIKVTLLPFDKYKRFQLASFCSIFSRIGFQIAYP